MSGQLQRYVGITAAEFPPLPSFPKTIPVGVIYADFRLTIHYWIPNVEAADLLASGAWAR